MKKIYSLAGLMLIIGICFAHEYILLAANYHLKRGDDLEVHLFVADGFNVQSERPFQKKITKSFELITSDSIIDLSNEEEGRLPVINRTVNFVGGGLIHLERDYARISLATGKFLAYLREDHIEGIASTVNKANKEQKERYTRYIKCLVQSEQRFTDTLYKRNTGQTFEIILLQNPYQLKTGSTCAAKVLFRGKPLAGKVITARNRTGSEPAHIQAVTTDKNGICTFRLSGKGEWFLHATHMIACPDKTDSDWESFWTSYSFSTGS